MSLRDIQRGDLWAEVRGKGTQLLWTSAKLSSVHTQVVSAYSRSKDVLVKETDIDPDVFLKAMSTDYLKQQAQKNEGYPHKDFKNVIAYNNVKITDNLSVYGLYNGSEHTVEQTLSSIGKGYKTIGEGCVNNFKEET